MNRNSPDKEERPLLEEYSDSCDTEPAGDYPVTVPIPKKEVDAYEKDVKLLGKLQKMERQQKSYRLASRFLVFCMIMLILLYGIDLLIINKGYINSKLLDSVFELLKFCVSSLMGFVFSIKLIQDKEDD
jgi:hypothetical protein